MSKEQGAGFYGFKIGEFEVASVSDGFLQFDNPKTMIAAGASEREFQAFMESKFLPSTTAYFQINSLYVDTGKHKVLIDNGMGPYVGPSEHFGNSAFSQTAQIDCFSPAGRISTEKRARHLDE